MYLSYKIFTKFDDANQVNLVRGERETVNTESANVYISTG